MATDMVASVVQVLTNIAAVACFVGSTALLVTAFVAMVATVRLRLPGVPLYRPMGGPFHVLLSPSGLDARGQAWRRRYWGSLALSLGAYALGWLFMIPAFFREGG